MEPSLHVSLNVSDVARSRDFYTAFFGVDPAKVKPGYVKFLPGFGPLNLALSQAHPSGHGGHVDHMGIQVDSQAVVVREMERVKAAGLPVREEFSVDCCHANQDKFWVQDPDGVDWEVYVLNHDIEEPIADVGSCACAPATVQQPMKQTLTVVKSSSCCSS